MNQAHIFLKLSQLHNSIDVSWEQGVTTTEKSSVPVPKTDLYFFSIPNILDSIPNVTFPKVVWTKCLQI